MAGFLDRVTGGGVRWALQLATGHAPYRPGDSVRGVVSLQPERDIDVRAFIVSLIAIERFSYIQRRTSGGSTSSSTEDETRELFRQDVPLGGAARLAGGGGFDVPFELALPTDAPPSLQTRLLSCSWRVEAKLDVGGRDPSVEQAIVVLEPAGRLMTTLGSEACGMRFDGVEEGITYAIWLEPAPLLLGAPFRGLADFGQPLGSGDVRVELRSEVESGDGFGTGASIVSSIVLGSGRNNVSEKRTIWTGGLAPDPQGAPPGAHRYAFGGQLPAELSPTVRLPDGECRATIAVVIPRRLRPDGRIARPVGLATVW